jgi:GTP-binding protein
MAFVDEIKLNLSAGDGGTGVVRWRHEKGKDKAGAAGGNGGRGGDVYLRGMRDLGVLAQYKQIKVFRAENGKEGMQSSMHGKMGKDITLDVPVGSVVTNLLTGKKINFLTEGETVKVLEGGNGGLGNEHFKASTNVRPLEWTAGKPGESADFLIELELVADLGLVGLPNAGKSSLLNALTNANSKVGSYPFTTLEPDLGDMFGFIIADIPGLIEGASEGKGLGHKFLRHIKRTKMILHLVALNNEDVPGAYKTIRNELNTYSKELADKPEIIILTKTDEVAPEVVEKNKKLLSKKAKTVLTVSVYDDASIKKLRDALVKILKK